MKLLVKGMAMLMAVTLFSCSNGNEGSNNRSIKATDEHTVSKENTADYTTADTVPLSANSSTLNLQTGSPAANIDWDKKMIKTANVRAEVTDFKTFNTAVHSNLKRFGAWIASEQQTET